MEKRRSLDSSPGGGRGMYKDDPNQCETRPAKCCFGPKKTILDEPRKENNWARST